MALLLFVFSAISWAASVDIPNTFTANTTAKASEVNANFGAVKTAVDDNDSRLVALEALVATLQTDLTSANSNIGTLQTNLATANVTIATLQSDMTTAQSGIDANTSDISGLQADSVPNLSTYLEITTMNGYDTALFSGINVQVVNGVDQTTLNGLGNLIVGYNDARTSGNEVCSDGQYDNQTD